MNKLPESVELPLTLRVPSMNVLLPESIKNPVFLVIPAEPELPVPIANIVSADNALLPSSAFHLPKKAEPQFCPPAFAAFDASYRDVP